MGETLASPNMEEINLINSLEIIIFKGIGSSTTHPIELDLEKNVLEIDFKLTNFRLYQSPLTESQNNFLREHSNSHFFLNQTNWI